MKGGSPLDVQLIVVGEALRRVMGKMYLYHGWSQGI